MSAWLTDNDHDIVPPLVCDLHDTAPGLEPVNSTSFPHLVLSAMAKAGPKAELMHWVAEDFRARFEHDHD